MKDDTTEYAAPCVLLLGGFDGLHIGHKKLIDCAKTYALPVGITTIEGGKGQSVFTLSERQKIFERQGLDFFHAFTFTEEFKNTSKEDFLSSLMQNFNVKAFVCGKDFRFGKLAQGTPEFIAQFTNIPVHALDILSVDNHKVSASSVKEYLKNGQIKKSNELLLQPFFVSGIVEEGRRTGRTLGFPTANLSYPKEKFPLQEGVYAVHTVLNEKRYNGIANFGPCPTFGVEYRKLEAYFDGFEGDLYGQEIDVYFDDYLRDIKKFETVEALQAQLKADIRSVRNVFTEGKE